MTAKSKSSDKRTTASIPWACPKCGAKANKHGRGGIDVCQSMTRIMCGGFLCACLDHDIEGTDTPTHGESYADPCRFARCEHCGWGGTFPKPPSKWPPWTKKALAAGWSPPPGWQP